MIPPAEIEKRLAELQRQGRHEAALELCEAMLSAAPARRRFLPLAGALALQAHRCDRAEAYLREALASRPNDVGVRVNHALALQELGRTAEATEAYGEVLRRDPHHVGANVNLGSLLMADEHWEDALECFERALQQAPHSVPALHNRAQALFRAGRHREAESACDALLAAKPGAASAHALRAALLRETGRLGEALGAFRTSLEIEPRAWRVRHQYAALLRRAGHFDEAADHFREALETEPGMPAPLRRVAELFSRPAARPGALDPALRARLQLARQRHREGLRTEAEELCRAILLEHPDTVAVRHLLGVIQAEQGDLADAVDNLRRCCEAEPTNIEYQLHHGAALRKGRHLPEAIAAFEALLLRRPRHKEALRNLAATQAAMRRHEEAAASYRRLLELSPADRVATLELGHQVMELGRHGEAANLFAAAEALGDPDGRAALARGILAEREERLDDAAAAYHQALARNPASAEAHLNLGNVHHELHHFAQAEACYRDSARVRPGYALAEHSLAMMQLLRGDYEAGLVGQEHRWRRDDSPEVYLKAPRWEGQPFRSLLVMSEGGVGDTLNFARYVALAKQRGGRVTLRCQKGLAGLLKGLAGADSVTERIPDEAFDFWVPTMSLPLVFSTHADTIPSAPRYLAADPRNIAAWRSRLRVSGAIHVGIFWQGNPRYPQDRRRSIPLRHYLPLAEVPRVRLFSLQKGHGREQLAALRDRFPAQDLGPAIDPPGHAFADTAAVLEALDLLVTSDSAIAHLAGALGVETWLMLPWTPDWRWGLEGESTPWYPSMRLFRQRARGDWAEVLGRVAEALRKRGAPASPL